MFNADVGPTSFVLPELARPGAWQIAVDTAQPTIGVEQPEGEPVVKGASYAVGSRSSAILVASWPARDEQADGAVA